jgi:predicted HTH domain antitoxin
MTTETIPIDVPAEYLISLNESEQELKSHFKVLIAMTLYLQGKLTIGKAAQYSGLGRKGFENYLADNSIPISNLTYEDIINDVQKMEKWQQS